MRKDAARNRALLVASARVVFAERGPGATLDDIAAHAGVGTGTAYRHFRNKAELAEEVLGEATEALVASAQRALAVDDPWDALVAFFESVAAQQVAEGGLYQVLAGYGGDEDKARLWPPLVAAVGELVERARVAGVVRAGITAEDVATLTVMLGPVFDLSRRTGTEVWRRYLALVLDGLAATEQPALPGPGPTYATFDDLIAAGQRPPARRPT